MFQLRNAPLRILGLSFLFAWGCGPGEVNQTPSGDSPIVTTGQASALGTRAFSPNGAIHPRGRPTTYFFEYGTGTEYGRRTVERPLPPRLAAYYNETWDSGLEGWSSWLENEHFAAGGVSGGYVSFSEPSRHDHNHDDGIGTLHLTKYLLSGRCKPSEGPCLAAGDADLRDAKVSISVRGHDWEPNGSELLWWSQSYIHIEMIDDPGYRAVNWAYTGHLLTDLLLDGEWHTAEYRLWNDTSYWSFGGNNPTKQGGVARRYDYGSIDLIQGHLNDDFFHLAAFIDTDNPPTGTIDFDEFQLVYRNESLVLPSNGGQLVKSPSDSSTDNAALTDGWRHGEGHQWRSAQNPSGPQEFVYSFQRPVTIDAVQLHQNLLWPGREVEVLVSQDGEDYSSLFKQELPEKGEKGVHPVNGEVPPVKGRPRKLPHYANRGKTSSSGGELASARSCFSTVRTALGKLRITGLLAQFDVARSFPQFPRPLLLQPTILTSERGTRFGIRKPPNHVPPPHLPDDPKKVPTRPTPWIRDSVLRPSS